MSKNNPSKKLEVLFICDYKPSTVATIIDHVSAFYRFSNHNIHVLNSVGDLPEHLNLNKFHAVVIHYSICIAFDYFITNSARYQLRKYKGLKVVYIQDDYRWINKTLSILDFMKVHVVFGLASQTIVDQVYKPDMLPTVRRRETVLAGYVHDRLIDLPKKKYEERTIDVGYRARKLPAWIGEHSQQKWQIADRFLESTTQYNLKCDISYREEDRIYGEDWFDFLSDCKSVLGTESGASVCDFTGEIQINVENHVAKHPNASFSELKELYFKDVDGKIMMNVISPRCFEAAALGTLMILYEGEYSGVLKPYRHYVPLATDHSNIDEVVTYIRDANKAKEITDCAYSEVILNPKYNYKAMAELFDQIALEEVEKLGITIKESYTPEQFSDLVEQFASNKESNIQKKSKLNEINTDQLVLMSKKKLKIIPFVYGRLKTIISQYYQCKKIYYKNLFLRLRSLLYQAIRVKLSRIKQILIKIIVRFLKVFG